MRLPNFIQENTKQITIEWETFARTLAPNSQDKTPLAMRDHILDLLSFIVGDMESPQTRLEQIQKSQGEKEQSSPATAAKAHAAWRLAGGFEIDQMVSEYRALRACIIKLWGKSNTQMNQEDITDLTRFNEAIDEELAESISYYTRKVNHSKDLFIGILGHDLRTPLNVISMSSQLMQKTGPLSEKQGALATQIYDSTSRITTIVRDLLDMTHARFGSGLPAIRAPMNMEFVSRQLIDEMQLAHPTRTITLDISGDVQGEWDKARIGQLLTNLIGNAIQYSFKDSPIDVIVKGSSDAVSLSVHNKGAPIPSEKIGLVFDSLTRIARDEGETSETVHLGLGLYIAQEIVVAHGGTIDVASSEEDGTTFTARLPRSARPNLEADLPLPDSSS